MRGSRRLVAVFVALSLLSLLAVGCAQKPADTGSKPAAGQAPAPAAPQAQAPKSIKIGAVVPLTGRYAAGGAQVKAGYELAVADINRDGGVLLKEFNAKVPIELVLVDDESDPTKTVSRLESLNDTDKVVAYLGGFGSDLHAAAGAVAEKNKVPYLGVAFALYKIHQQGYKYLFSPFTKSPDYESIFSMLNTLIPTEGQRPKKVGLLTEKTDWGKELAEIWGRTAGKYGYQVVFQQEYAPGAKDFSDAISRAKTAGVELLLGLPNPPDGITIAKQMAELGFKPKAAFFVRAPDGPNWGQVLGKVGDGFLLAPGWHHAVSFKGAKELNEAHKAKFNRPADPMVGPAYAAVQTLAAALANAPKLDRSAVRDALAAVKVDTVVGPVAFNPDGTAKVPTVYVQWIDGKQELIWPKEFATKPLLYPMR